MTTDTDVLYLSALTCVAVAVWKNLQSLFCSLLAVCCYDLWTILLIQKFQQLLVSPPHVHHSYGTVIFQAVCKLSIHLYRSGFQGKDHSSGWQKSEAFNMGEHNYQRARRYHFPTLPLHHSYVINSPYRTLQARRGFAPWLPATTEGHRVSY